MSHSYTPKFLEAYNIVRSQVDQGEEAVRRSFVEQMLKLGPIERIQNLYRIKDKLSGKFRRFKLHREQLEYLEERSGHDAILKSRQIGFTTLHCIYAYDRAIFDRWATGIMAHKQETVKLIFEIVKNANFWFRKDWGHLYAPEEEANNTSRISWSDLKSSITVAYDFQGLTLNFLHVSEAAFIAGPRLTNSMQAVPETGEVTMESTANGRGGFFYELWQDWKRDSGSAPFHGHFFPWFKHYPELPERWKKDKAVQWTPEEEELKTKYGLEDHHLAWRRYKIKESCGGSAETFDIQYPSDDVTCFLSGESNVIPRSVLTYQETFVHLPKHFGALKLNGKKVDLLRDPKGALKIWHLPKPDSVYGGGADPSSGHGGDAGCAILIDYRTGEQVAELYGFFEPDLFADELYKLGQFYNQAFWCIEANNHGTAVLLALKGRYPNLYKRQEFDTIAKKMSSQLGFYTTSTSKTTITDNFSAALRDGNFKVNSDALLSELSTFVNVIKKSSDGRFQTTSKREALPGCHDDRVMAACLAYEMVRSRPVSFEKESGLNPDLPGFHIDVDTGFLTYQDAFYNDFLL